AGTAQRTRHDDSYGDARSGVGGAGGAAGAVARRMRRQRIRSRDDAWRRAAPDMSRGLPLHIGGMTLRALRRDGWVTAFAVLTIGLGTAASRAMVAILHAISGDPLPGRSQQLFYPHLDASPTGFANETGLDPTEGFKIGRASSRERV